MVIECYIEDFMYNDLTVVSINSVGTCLAGCGLIVSLRSLYFVLLSQQRVVFVVCVATTDDDGEAGFCFERFSFVRRIEQTISFSANMWKVRSFVFACSLVALRL